MLSEQRHRMILKILEEKRAVTFAPVTGGTILTDERMDEFKDAADIVLCR